MWRTVSFLLLAVFLAVSGPGASGYTAASFYTRRDFIPVSETALIHVIDGRSVKDPQNTDKVLRKQAEIHSLLRRFEKEEEKLIALVHLRERLKDGFFWFFDPDKQLSVERMQFQVNAQHRRCENVLDDIHFHVKEVKPYIGPISQLCAWDLWYSFIKPLEIAYEFFFSLPFDYSLLSLLAIVPFLLYGSLVFWTFGVVLVPILAQLYLLFWLVKVPVILIQYRPDPTEFTALYCGCIVLCVGLWQGLTMLFSRHGALESKNL